MDVKQIFRGVFKIDGRLATPNLVKGRKVYDEELVMTEGKEYRMWNPYRSKLAAAIINGLKELEIRPGAKVLYLGAATGTTASHVSDIVGKSGQVYCIEISERNMRELVKMCEFRENLLPMLQDAQSPEAYAKDADGCDVLYQDVSARAQAQILLRNAVLLKKGGVAYVAIKSQSIDVVKDPRQVFKEFLEEVKEGFDVLQEIGIEPYSRLHLFVALKKK